ncbi:MAG: hypothetical protein R2834_19380 [Rhodothermales bacterium]
MRIVQKAGLALASLFVIGAIGFYWNEARKEVVFLCGNFVEGVPEASVRRQLDTGNLLRYHTVDTHEGRQVRAESLMPFGVPACVVDLDAAGVVVAARLE